MWLSDIERTLGRKLFQMKMKRFCHFRDILVQPIHLNITLWYCALVWVKFYKLWQVIVWGFWSGNSKFRNIFELISIYFFSNHVLSSLFQRLQLFGDYISFTHCPSLCFSPLHNVFVYLFYFPTYFLNFICQDRYCGFHFYLQF